MKAWDKKDSSDKVRSKQTMRVSRMVQRKRADIRREERLGKYNRDDLDSEEEAVLAEKKQERLQRAKRQREEEEALGEDFRARHALLHGEVSRSGSARRGPASTKGGESANVAESELLATRMKNAALRRLM